MVAEAIRVDADTARLVAQLAHLMESTKRSVMADAVAAYAEARLPALTTDRPGFSELSPRERLRLRRDEVLRAFARHGASNVRVLDPIAPFAKAGVAGAVGSDDHSGSDDGTADEAIDLLAETDIMMGGEAASVLSGIASRMLGVRVEVTSMTSLAMFAPERLARSVECSSPL
ncbi:hypothetical protein [Agromyces sp. Leaf222]|uniref:hypothetical protein n=1 Tax=Agromyces sp. Leaf222 TaxID=1735688 RepID=UPI0007000FDD|nr:hypothetical protein [Agromyces sp. Leaf222]KQM81219.1 hypothetical protein ASE68_15545 [Agromyces sp. Leaf222]